MRNTKLERRHFVLIAEVLSQFSKTREGQAIALAFAHRLKQSNSNFKTSRFLEACGINEGATVNA
jgi:hypothetical protein